MDSPEGLTVCCSTYEQGKNANITLTCYTDHPLVGLSEDGKSLRRMVEHVVDRNREFECQQEG